MSDSYEKLKKAFIEAVMKDMNLGRKRSNSNVDIDNYSFKSLEQLVKQQAEETNSEEIINFINTKGSSENLKEWIIDTDYCYKHKIQYTLMIFVLAYLILCGIIVTSKLFNYLKNSSDLQKAVTVVKNEDNDKKEQAIKDESVNIAKKVELLMKNPKFRQSVRNTIK